MARQGWLHPGAAQLAGLVTAHDHAKDRHLLGSLWHRKHTATMSAHTPSSGGRKAVHTLPGYANTGIRLLAATGRRQNHCRAGLPRPSKGQAGNPARLWFLQPCTVLLLLVQGVDSWA